MNINDLPHELLEEIFSHLTRCKKYRRLSEVCKNFKEVIESSPRLMKELKIEWDEDDKDPTVLLTTTRKYKKIEFTSVYIKYTLYLLQFLEQQPITELYFSNCEFSMVTLWMIINQVKDTVEYLYFRGIGVKKNCDVIPIHMPNLRKFNVPSGEPKKWIIDLFVLPLNLEKFVYSTNSQRETPISIEVAKRYRDILVNSTNLKEMNLYDDLASKLFDDSIFMEQAKFKLERFHMYQFQNVFTSDQISNSVIFLRHQNCLKELDLGDFSITHESLKVILSMPILKKLQLTSPSFQICQEIYVKNASIRTLDLNGKWLANPPTEPPENSFEDEIGICAIIKACSSLRRLRLASYHVTKMISETIANLKNLETLDLFLNWKMHAVKFPTVTKMRIFGLKKDERTIISQIFDLIQLNPQLKSLSTYDHIVNHPTFKETTSLLNLGDLKFETL